MQQDRHYALDGLKGIFIFLITLMHYHVLLSDRFPYFGFMELTDIMFIISGFLTYEHYHNRCNEISCWDFWKHRYLRMAPGIILSLAFMELAELVIIHFYGKPWVAYNGHNDLWTFVCACLGIHMWVGTTPAVNGPIWFVSALLFQTILFYFLNKISRVTGNIVFALPILVGLAMTPESPQILFFNYWMGDAFYGFYIGVILSILASKKGGWFKEHLTFTRVTVIASLIVYSFFYSIGMVGDVGLVCTFFLYPIIIVWAVSDNTANILLGNKFLRWLGAISFGIYIWQTPVQLLMKSADVIFDLSMDFGSVYIYLLHAAFIILAGMLWRVFEKKVVANVIGNRFI